jgi:hypothetical protein
MKSSTADELHSRKFVRLISFAADELHSRKYLQLMSFAAKEFSAYDFQLW